MIAMVASLEEELQAWGQQVASQYSVPWPIFNAMINQESGWNPNSPNSSTGAIGIAQIEPGTAAGWGVDPHDPFMSLEAAATHLSEYYTQFGNSWSNALAAYNGGASPQGMAASYAQGYPQKILAAAGMSGSAPGSAPSAGAGSSSNGASPSPATPVNFTGAILLAIIAIGVLMMILGLLS